ncbi:MAG: amidohydrolase family protein [Proteobacteria bacterium]|nr:amidohydrolase family protein [Pseudomonadota bacterium]
MSRLFIALSLLLTPAAASAACTVLTGGATVYLPEGPKEGVELRLADGRITEVGAKVGATEGDVECAVVDATGMTITAGLVESSSNIGVVEVGAEKATVDSTGDGDGVRAALRVIDAYNPRSTLIPIQRVEGITSAVVKPEGGRIAGQGGWANLAGATQSEAVVKPNIGVWASFGGASRAQGLLQLRELLDDARFLRRKGSAYDSGNSRELAASRLDLMALYPVLDGELPLVVGVNRASDIEALLRLAKEQGILLVLSGGAEAWMVADQLAEANTPVILDPLTFGPGGFDQMHARADNAKLLDEAGVTVVLSSFSSHNARTLKQVAGNAVREGMDHTAAIEAITRGPAQAFGLDDYGKIEAGAVANVVVWSGDPLEIGTAVEQVFISGRSIPLQSRQTELRDRYRTLPGTPVPALPVE